MPNQMSSRSSSSRTGNMVGQPLAAERGRDTCNGASGSRCDRDTSSSGSGGSSGSSSGVDTNNDSSSPRVSKSRPLARLDRLLRRWLPGYNYLRGAAGSVGGDASSGGRQSPGTGAATPSLSALEEQRSGGPTPVAVDPPLLVRKRRDGEVLLDTGIAKSEFCLKLEKLLRAKLAVKD